MKSLFIPSERKGFSVIDNELREVQVVRYFIDFGDSSHNTLFVKHRGQEYSVSPENFYESVEKFRANERVAFEDFIYPNGWIKRANFDDSQPNVLDFYTFEDGEPKHHELVLNYYFVHFGEDGRVTAITNDEIPEIRFRTREDCLSANDFIVTNEDGTSRIVQGATKLSMLNDEQRAVVNDISGLLKKAKELGVRFISEYTEIYAINIKALEENGCRISVDYGSATSQQETVNFSDYGHSVGSLWNYLNEEEAIFVERES